MTVIEEEERKLFVALLEGDDKSIEEALHLYVYGNEYIIAHDGGEPDLEHILAVKLLERLRGHKQWSLIYQDVYLKHVGITYKGKEREK